MKLIKQKTLYFSEGNSDKVYEVDLCENQDLFVVNFRYGRRGANLREGTKTVFPVAYEEAEQVFNKLVESKEKKGYLENDGQTQKPTSKPKETIVNTVREKTILKYLQQAVANTYTRDWKVSRIILRAGQLNIIAAADLIAKFLDSTDEFEQHNAIIVLASFENTTCKDQILKVFKKQKFNTISGRAACAYILKYGNAADKKNIHTEVSNYVSEAIFNELPLQFVNGNTLNPSLLYYAYIFSYNNESLRQKLYQLIDKIGLKVNTFKSIRYIYRACQITDDLLFFALISKRIAVSKPGYTSDYVYSNNEWISANEEKQKANPSIAFSAKTKDYFNKATYKKVYDLSHKNTDGYIAYATEVLCALNDKEDQTKEEFQYYYNYDSSSGRYDMEKRCFPKYHNFLALMYILYGNSSRFQHQKNKWFYIDELGPNANREEALSEIWNTKPDEVLKIVANAKSDIAVEFSLRILKDNTQFLDDISDELITKLVRHYHPKVLDLIIDALEKKYRITQPEDSVVIALLKSKNEKGVQLGLNWLKTYERNYFTTSIFIVELLLTDEVEVITYLQNLYKHRVVYNFAIPIEKLEPLFLEFNTFNSEFLNAVNDLIGNTEFGQLLKETPSSKIVELSNSKLVSNKLFALNLAKRNKVPAYELFKASYDEYIKSDEEVLRKAGIELIAHFPDEFLLENKQDLVGFCFSEYREVREAIQRTIERLVKLDSSFKNRLLSQLLMVITEAETYDGLHQNCYELLTRYFDKDLPSISDEQIMILILSKYEFAQNLGTPIFENRIKLSLLSMPQLVQLAHSDVFSIREKLHDFFKANTSRINYELEEALPIFNTNWQDVIDWSCAYFDAHIDPENWTTELLLYVCDHVKPDVQAFGMKMITKYFSDEKGLPLLLKLQEHPTKRIQFFVTNYLEAYAKGNPEIILKLEPYFKTSLFNINSNRTTKTRIYTFLEQESLKNEEVAKMTVRIINSILDTKTIKDKSKNIDILLKIALNYPTLEVPLIINDITNEV
ncbi:WGR domain-containing protein [Winogradskyella forsetii]|uniref:WGR domain-containing protein n=1 Tax=Winogradskyella forsetii TaxID=2686077 RepID=UPI0015BAF953|nr:WGR domain-containing protein [Winogradskyella forsetii]